VIVINDDDYDDDDDDDDMRELIPPSYRINLPAFGLCEVHRRKVLICKGLCCKERNLRESELRSN
jgi:hypothetical protein